MTIERTDNLELPLLVQIECSWFPDLVTRESTLERRQISLEHVRVRRLEGLLGRELCDDRSAEGPGLP